MPSNKCTFCHGRITKKTFNVQDIHGRPYCAYSCYYTKNQEETNPEKELDQLELLHVEIAMMRKQLVRIKVK